MSPKQKKAIVICICILLSGIVSFLITCNKAKDNYIETHTYENEVLETSAIPNENFSTNEDVTEKNEIIIPIVEEESGDKLDFEIVSEGDE